YGKALGASEWRTLRGRSCFRSLGRSRSPMSDRAWLPLLLDPEGSSRRGCVRDAEWPAGSESVVQVSCGGAEQRCAQGVVRFGTERGLQVICRGPGGT